MKLSVRVRGDWFAVPCKGTEKVTWLGEESLRRYYKSKSRTGHAQEKVYEVRKAKGAAILDPDDAIKDVLDENDFVTVGKGILIMHILRSCNVYHRINDRSCKSWVETCIGDVSSCSPLLFWNILPVQNS